MNAHVDVGHSPMSEHRSGRPLPGKYKLRVEDYLLLDEAGAFGGQETELVDGDVIIMSPEWMPHMRIKDEIAYRLRRAIEELGLDLRVGTGGSVELSGVSQPRPDVIVMNNVRSDRAVPGDAVLLLVEVSSSTLVFDRETKAPSYGRNGVAECWIVDVKARAIHRMWSPSEGGYAEGDEVAFGLSLASATIAGVSIETADLL